MFIKCDPRNLKTFTQQYNVVRWYESATVSDRRFSAEKQRLLAYKYETGVLK